MSNFENTVTTTTTNEATGEVVEVVDKKSGFIKHSKTDDFVMTFTKTIGYMKNLTKGEILLSLALLKYVNNSNEVILNAEIKKRISQEFDMKVNSINQHLTELKKKNVLISTGTGVFLLNAHLFGKGKFANLKTIRHYQKWDFKEEKHSFSINFEYFSDDELEYHRLNLAKKGKFNDSMQIEEGDSVEVQSFKNEMMRRELLKVEEFEKTEDFVDVEVDVEDIDETIDYEKFDKSVDNVKDDVQNSKSLESENNKLREIID